MLHTYTLSSVPTHANFIMQLILTICMIAFCLSIMSIIFRPQAKKSKHSWYHIDNNEYNFMAAEESEQSRLDLAQAYLDIDQIADASIILSELSQVKNPLIKEQAKQMLSNLKTQHPH